MKLRWRWVALVAVVINLMVNSGQSQANEPDESRRGFVGFPTCANSGTCVDATCNERGRYLAIGGVLVDFAGGGQLWQRGFGPQGNYAAAEAYCASLVIHGLRGWRLPTNPEMGTIVLRPRGLGRPDACDPSLDQAAFSFPDPTTSVQFFWTTTGGGTLPIRLVRDFSDGRAPRAYEDDTEIWVRCVHDPLF